MKEISKENINKWHIGSQIGSRPNKTAKGIGYTNERRAKQDGNFSFFYAVILTNRKVSDACRTLSVKGTTDTLASLNSVKRYKFKKWHEGRKTKAL